MDGPVGGGGGSEGLDGGRACGCVLGVRCWTDL